MCAFDLSDDKDGKCFVFTKAVDHIKNDAP